MPDAGADAGFCVLPVTGIPEVAPGDDIAALIADRFTGCDNDIVVVTSKVVSKAEGRFRPASEKQQAILEESRRIVASRQTDHGTILITENHLGIVQANAGIDESNSPDGHLILLPKDPDQSARGIRSALEARWGVSVAVVITDTAGRPWRLGHTDIAIGASGMAAFLELQGTVDDDGRPLRVTRPCVLDEVAAAADLVKGKTSRCPVVVVRGLGALVAADVGEGAAAVIRDASEDLFRHGG